MAFQLNPQMIRDALDRAAQDIPPLQNVLVKILQLTESSDSGTVGEIESLIKSDQAVSSKLLRVVNSAYFGLSGQVSSVSQAVVILGFQQVRNLVLSVSMMSSFSAPGSKSKVAQQKLWTSAFATASAAQLMGRKKKLDPKDLELVFVGGLLQNIGALFMLNTLSRSYVAVLEEAEAQGTRLFDLENTRLGANHAEIGAALLKKWGLPENLILLVARHEGPFEGEAIPTLAVVHAAERLGDLVALGKPYSAEALGLDPVSSAFLGFTDADYEWLWGEVKVKVDAALELIGSLNES